MFRTNLGGWIPFGRELTHAAGTYCHDCVSQSRVNFACIRTVLSIFYQIVAFQSLRVLRLSYGIGAFCKFYLTLRVYGCVCGNSRGRVLNQQGNCVRKMYSSIVTVAEWPNQLHILFSLSRCIICCQPVHLNCSLNEMICWHRQNDLYLYKHGKSTTVNRSI